MTRNNTTGAPTWVTLIALSMASANLWAEQQKYRFPPMEEATQAEFRTYPNDVRQNSPVTTAAEPQVKQPPQATPPVAAAAKTQPTVRSYQRTIPPGAVPPVARPNTAPPRYNTPPRYTAPPRYAAPAPYANNPAGRMPYPAPRPYANAPMNRPYSPYASNRGPAMYPPPVANGAPPPNLRAPGAPLGAGAVPPPYYPPVAGPGPYRGHPGAAPWNRGYRSGPFNGRSGPFNSRSGPFNSRSGPFNNRSFGRNFFDKGPFKHGPFGRKSPPWDYDEDDNFGFFDIIPSEELEEIWDDMIAGPEDGDIPGPMDWPSIEMPGPFEVGEQVEDVMYEVPSFFGDGYGYDSEDDY